MRKPGVYTALFSVHCHRTVSRRNPGVYTEKEHQATPLQLTTYSQTSPECEEYNRDGSCVDQGWSSPYPGPGLLAEWPGSSRTEVILDDILLSVSFTLSVSQQEGCGSQ